MGGNATIIEFTIVTENEEVLTYQAEEGMTWADFYVSDYNIDEWISELLNPPKQVIYNYLTSPVRTQSGLLNYDISGNGMEKFGNKIINGNTYYSKIG